jgi:hypothetical protein
MPFIYADPWSLVEDKSFYRLFIRRDGLIVGIGAFCIGQYPMKLPKYAASGERIWGQGGAVVTSPMFHINAISTHIDYRKRGFATNCLVEAFARAEKLGMVLDIGPFGGEGRKYMTKKVSAIHARFFQVPIRYWLDGRYGEGRKTITAKRPYKIITCTHERIQIVLR